MKPDTLAINEKAPPTIFGTWKTDKAGNDYYDTSKHGGKPAKQSFKDQCDINRIVDKAKRTGIVSHVAKNADFYADMTDFDYEDAMNKIADTNTVFYELDAEIRREFENNPGNFRARVSKMTPDEIREKIPQLAAPETQFPDVMGGTQTEPPPPEAPPAEGGGPDSGETPTP